eukprot:12909075-Prorocentrum_lima.AAC.1
MHERYRSLLGALAWLLMSHADIAPFVGFMQRQAHKRKNKHLKFIMCVLRYCKRVKTGMYLENVSLLYVLW